MPIVVEAEGASVEVQVNANNSVLLVESWAVPGALTTMPSVSLVVQTPALVVLTCKDSIWLIGLDKSTLIHRWH